MISLLIADRIRVTFLQSPHWLSPFSFVFPFQAGMRLRFDLIEQLASSQFHRLGIYISKHPYPFIAFPLLLTLACSVGMCSLVCLIRLENPHNSWLIDKEVRWKIVHFINSRDYFLWDSGELPFGVTFFIFKTIGQTLHITMVVLTCNWRNVFVLKQLDAFLTQSIIGQENYSVNYTSCQW